VSTPYDIPLRLLSRPAKEVRGCPQREIAETTTVPLPLYLSYREFFYLALSLYLVKTSFARSQDSATAEILKHGELSSKLIPISVSMNSDPATFIFTVQDEVVMQNLKGGGLL